jgi:CheY-like chemotaxis protein
MPKVLIVEDNEHNWDMLSRRLTRRNYSVVLAHDGLSGVQVAQAERPDLILMDVNLDGIDGLEATRRIRQIDEIARTPIIAITAHALSGDREKAIAAGCDDYHTKPVELPRLLGQMETLLGDLAP